MHKYAILGGGVPFLLNKHFLTKFLVKNSLIYFCSLIYFIYLCNTETKQNV